MYFISDGWKGQNISAGDGFSCIATQAYLNYKAYFERTAELWQVTNDPIQGL